jgi:hypothetical protein
MAEKAENQEIMNAPVSRIENEKAPALADEMQNAGADILNTITGTDPISKAQVYNALTNPTGALSDMIGKTVNMVDVVGQYVEMVDDQTSELTMQPRIVLIDADGKSYGAVSKGVLNALKQIFVVIGQPHYDIPLPLDVLQKKGRHGYNFLTLEINIPAYQKLNK